MNDAHDDLWRLIDGLVASKSLTGRRVAIAPIACRWFAPPPRPEPSR